MMPGVGSLVGAWLASNGLAEVCLLGRTGRDSGSALLDSLRRDASGACVTMTRCDVTTAEDTACLTARMAASRPLWGVVHAGA